MTCEKRILAMAKSVEMGAIVCCSGHRVALTAIGSTKKKIGSRIRLSGRILEYFFSKFQTMWKWAAATCILCLVLYDERVFLLF